MPGLVGYTCAEALKGHGPLNAMIGTMGSFAVDRFYGQSLHIARLHLGIFNVEKQPVWNESKTLGIVTYGKIYDYQQAKQKLQGLGHKFAYADNDAEFILHAYEEFGKTIFQRLNGSYTFAIFDSNFEKLMIVTDRFGTRPMYYALKDGNLIFASTARAILKYPYPKNLNESVVVKFFRYGKLGILGDDTWFDGIQSIPSASYLEFKDGKTHITQYWDINYLTDHAKDEEAFVRELSERFRKAVDSRISDAITFGVSLSGGLDSRAVCGAMTKKKLAKAQAYTFGVENCNEFKIAELTTRTIGLKKHHLIKLDPETFIEYAEQVVHLTDGMDTIDVSFLPYVYEEIKKLGINVFLQGFAFDATLGGSFLNEAMFKARNIDDLLSALDKWYTLFSPLEIKALLDTRLRHMVKSVHREFAEAVRNAKGDSLPNKADYFTLKTRVRRFTIMGSVIAREFVEESLPTIDNEVMDIISRIPPECRYRHHLYKKFLSALNPKLAGIPYVKTMVRADASNAIWKFGMTRLKLTRFTKRVLWKLSRGRIYIPNKHYYIDMGEVWRTNPTWQGLLNRTILNDDSLCYKMRYLNKEFVREVVNEHYSGVKNNSEKMAFLISFEIFLRIHWQDKTEWEKLS